MNKFWNFSEDETGRVLHLNGTIASESWVDDDVTPQIFKNELMGSKAEITMASGVSSTTISTPVAASKARMLRPSRPMMRPFTSSLSM